MGRIKGRDSRATRRDTLAAATRAFATHGFAGASLSRIAADAGVTPATLAYHHGGKQGLHDAVIDGIYEDIGALAVATDAPADLEGLLAWVWDRGLERRDGIRVLLRAILERGEVGERLRRERVLPALALGERLVSARFDVPAPRARRAVVALTHLVTRFLTQHPDDNRATLGAADAAETRAVVVEILATTGRALLGPAPRSAP